MALRIENLALVIRQPLTDDLLAAVRDLVTEHDADYALLRDGPQCCMLFMCNPYTRMSFEDGLDSIDEKLLGGPVERIELPTSPRWYFCKHWPGGLPDDAMVEYDGNSFSPEAIGRAYTVQRRLRDPNVRLGDLVRDGDIHILDVPRLARAREIMFKKNTRPRRRQRRLVK
jgi:hypothetical protein